MERSLYRAGYCFLAPNPRRGICIYRYIQGVGICPAQYLGILGTVHKVLWQHTTPPEGKYNSLAVYFRELWCELRVELLNEVIFLHVEWVVGFFGDDCTGRCNNGWVLSRLHKVTNNTRVAQ